MHMSFAILASSLSGLGQEWVETGNRFSTGHCPLSWQLHAVGLWGEWACRTCRQESALLSCNVSCRVWNEECLVLYEWSRMLVGSQTEMFWTWLSGNGQKMVPIAVPVLGATESPTAHINTQCSIGSLQIFQAWSIHKSFAPRQSLEQTLVC